MHVRHAGTAIVLVAGMGALATLASLGGGAGRSSDQPLPAVADAVRQEAGDERPTTSPRSTTADRDGTAARPGDQARSGPPSAFVPIPAYRMYDSRNDPLGIWVRGDVDHIDAVTDENLHPRIPEDATAVTFNVTITQTEGIGFVQVFGPGTSPLSTSTVNWVTAGADAANSGSVQLGDLDGIPGYLQVAVGGTEDAAAHVILDITGYYESLAVG